MPEIVVRLSDLPAASLPALRQALAAEGLMVAADETPRAAVIICPLGDSEAQAAARANSLRQQTPGCPPAVLAVGEDDAPASYRRAARAGCDLYALASDPVRLAVLCRLLAACRARFAQVNPLTGLPGNGMLEEEIVRRLPRRGELSVVAFDLDNFKGYNDRYGYRRGDELLLWMAAALANVLSTQAQPGWFLAHVGGDDFFALVQSGESRRLAEAAMAAIDNGIGAFYDPVDRQNGYIVTMSRRGETERQPLLTLTVAQVGNQAADVTHPGQVAALLAELKRYGKSLPGSNYVPDRRRSHD